MSETWYISTPAFTVAIDFEDGQLVGGPPITRWAKGKNIKWLRQYWDRRWPKEVVWHRIL